MSSVSDSFVAGATVPGAVVAGGAAATVVVPGAVVAGAAAAAAVVAGVFGLNSVISIGGAILVSSMSPSGGCGVLAGGAGAGGFKAGLMSPLSSSNASFTLFANAFASAAVDRGVVCISTTCFKLGILAYNALPILPTTFDGSNFFFMYDRMLSAAATKVGSQDDAGFRLRHVARVF